MSAPLLAGIVHNSGHFDASSAAELTKIYQTSAIKPANYTAAAGYCGPQAAFAVAPAGTFVLVSARRRISHPSEGSRMRGAGGV